MKERGLKSDGGVGDKGELVRDRKCRTGLGIVNKGKGGMESY